jgi:hypothetical protein
MLEDFNWTQKPQKYHAKSLETLRAKHASVAGHAGLNKILSAADISF